MLTNHLKALKLTAFADHCVQMAEHCEKEGPLTFLNQLVALEVERREQACRERLLKAARLPRQKSLKDFHIDRIKGFTRTKLDQMIDKSLIERCQNILVFGNPGTGKTHLALGLAQEWCLQKKRVLFTTATKLAQSLWQAKCEGSLDVTMKKLRKFDMLIIDDMGYLSCSSDEAYLLFTVLCERYEMGSVMITSHIAFAGWEAIFKDRTVALVDRLVHHATIVELDAESYRMPFVQGEACKNQEKNFVAREEK